MLNKIINIKYIRTNPVVKLNSLLPAYKTHLSERKSQLRVEGEMPTDTKGCTFFISISNLRVLICWGDGDTTKRRQAWVVLYCGGLNSSHCAKLLRPGKPWNTSWPMHDWVATLSNQRVRGPCEADTPTLANGYAHIDFIPYIVQ